MRYILLTFTNLIIAGSLMAGIHFAATGPFTDVCQATPTATVCQETNKSPQSANGTNSIYGPGSILAKVTTLLALIVGIASVIVIVVAGIKFAVSGGDSNGITSARNTAIYAVIGLLIAAVAQSIVVFVINKI